MPLAPSLALSLLIAGGYGAFFHTLFGRRVREIPLYILASAGGFMAGAALASLLSSGLPLLGSVPIIEGSLGAWLCLFFTNRLLS